MKVDRSRSTRHGASLVETMFAILLLTILALAGASYLYHAKAQIGRQRTRRAVLEAVNGRLEAIRALHYDLARPQAFIQDYAVYHLSRLGTNWVHSATDPLETMVVNGITLPVSSTVQFMDLDGGVLSYDYIKVAAGAGFRSGTSDRLMLESYYAPPKL